MVTLLQPNQLGPLNTTTLSLQSGKIPPPNDCSGYATNQFDGDDPVMLELWEMLSILSLPLFSDPLCPGVVVLDRALFMGQIELVDI